jgi:hypothetical protein
LESTVRARLNADAFEAEFARGRATGMDHAAAYALERIGGPEESAN